RQPRAHFSTSSTDAVNNFPISSVMIRASLSFSSNNNSAAPSINSARVVNRVLRYLREASSARFRCVSISASSKAGNSFSFSPVAGLIEPIGICLTKRVGEDEQRGTAIHSMPIKDEAKSAGPSESTHDQEYRRTIVQAERAMQRELRLLKS